jgi:F-type H+-transporting ATPase subunit c
MRAVSKLFVPVAAFFVAVLAAPLAFAQGGGNPTEGRGWVALATAITISVAAFGGALGQGRAAAAALDGIARNPQASGKIFVPMIVALALIESLVIYGLVIALGLSGKV